MRCLLVALCLFGFAAHASAQDFDVPTLRGSSPFIPATPQHTRWDGFYVGGQLGLVSANMDLTNAFGPVNIFDTTNPITGPLGHVSSWGVFGQKDVRSSSYGAFFGYNTQWADAIVGLELNYSSTSAATTSSGARCYSSTPSSGCLSGITLGNGFTYDTNVTTTASARITDYGAIRARGGWAIGTFMPYGLAGVAVARADIRRTANAVFFVVTPGDPALPPHTESDVKTRFTWGYSLGVGVDFLVMPNVFVRGEYEQSRFSPVDGIRLNISTARVGAGLKF